MSNPQGSVSVNTAHIQELSKQIQNTTDCGALGLILQEHMKCVSDLAKAISKEEALILSEILPILTLPGISPTAIVAWLGKLVMGMAAPQLRAYINYALQLINIGSAIQGMASAIAAAAERLGKCAIAVPASLLSDAVTLTNALVTPALTQIGSAQGLMNTVANGSLPLYDVSSATAFQASVTNNTSAFNKAVVAYQNA